MLQKLGIVVLGAVWSLAVFTFASPLLFPSELFEKRAEYFVQDSTRGSTLIDLKDLSFLGLAGLTGTLDVYKGEKQRRRKRRRKASATTGAPPVYLLTVDRFKIRPQIFPLLAGRAMASVELVFGDGELEGSIGADSTALYIDLDTEDMDLAAFPGIDNDALSMNISGKANILSDLVLNQEDPKESTGDLSLTIDDLQLFNGKAKTYGLDLMPTSFTESVLKFSVADGRASVTEGRFVGDLVEADVEGDIILNKKFSRSRLSLTIKVKILDAAMDTLLKSMSTTKRARDDEGYYHFRGSGTLSNPRFMPDRSKSGGGGSMSGANGLDDQKGARRSNTRFADDDGDERRRKRRDRIKKRRERMKERRRKRREREAQQRDDDMGEEDDFRDEEPVRRRRALQFDEDEIQGNQLPPENDYPPSNEPEYDDEVDEEDEEVQEELEELGYNE